MGLFKKRRSFPSPMPGVSPQEAIGGAFYAAQEHKLALSDSFLYEFTSMHHGQETPFLLAQAIAGKDMRDWEAQPALVVGEALRLALQRRDPQSYEEICNTAAILLIRWQRWLMEKNLMPDDDRWGRDREA